MRQGYGVEIRVSVQELAPRSHGNPSASEWFMPLVRELEASNASCQDKDQKPGRPLNSGPNPRC